MSTGLNMLKNLPGTYAVILLSRVDSDVNIGTRLRLSVQPGYYIYVGSAFGPGGVASRIKHHISAVKRPHWHLDYLRQFADVIEVWFTYDTLKRECQWASLISSIGVLYSPIKGFGATDCTCSTHLMYSSTRPDYKQFKDLAMNQISGQQPIDFLTMESREDANR